jgi:amino acid transporter
LFARKASGLVRQLSAKDAFVFSISNMGLGYILVLMYLGVSVYQGVNFPVTILIAMPPVLAISVIYYMFSVAFPRSGGEYVWVSRILNPAVGYMVNFALFVFNLALVGTTSAWIMLFGFSTMFTNLSYVTGNAAFGTLATQVTAPNMVLAAGLIYLVVLVVAAMIGLKYSFRFLWVTFGIALLGTVVYIASMIAAGPSGFQAGFNAQSGASYSAIIGAANKLGLTTAYTTGGTLLGTVYSFLIFLGFWFSSYVGGEVKDSKRSQLYGIVGSTLVFGIIAFVATAATYYAMGGQFFNAASLLSGAANPAYSLASPPSPTFLVIFANPNPWVAVLVPLATIATVFGGQETVILATVRMVFAWSFDKVAPMKLSEVGKRTGSPNYALALVALVALVYVLAFNFLAGFLTLYAYATSGIFLAISVVGIAALVFPYRHKDWFEASPSPVNKKVAGIPIVSIFGLISLLSGIGIAYAAATPAFTGAPVNPTYLVFLFLVFLVGVLIYGVSFYLRKREGIDLSANFKEIPPE